MYIIWKIQNAIDSVGKRDGHMHLQRRTQGQNGDRIRAFRDTSTFWTTYPIRKQLEGCMKRTQLDRKQNQMLQSGACGCVQKRGCRSCRQLPPRILMPLPGLISPAVPSCPGLPNHRLPELGQASSEHRRLPNKASAQLKVGLSATLVPTSAAPS
jgi:hypothetical protein